MLRDFRATAFWAGITGFIWYAFGAVPLHIAVAEQLGTTAEQTSSWIFIVWFAGAVSSIALTVVFRQPIPITWSIPGLIYLGTLAGRFTIPEIVGANLIAGLLILALALARSGLAAPCAGVLADAGYLRLGGRRRSGAAAARIARGGTPSTIAGL